MFLFPKNVETPLIINSIWQSIAKETIEVFTISSNEETDSRLTFHVGMSNEVLLQEIPFLPLIYALGQLGPFSPPSLMVYEDQF